MTMNILFTEAASHYIQMMIEKKQAIGLRLSVKKTGCSGYSYVPTIVEAEVASDMIMTLDNGVKIFIDTAWQELLQNLQVDYREENISGLKQKRLIFINPKESGRCGCGESFHIE